MKISRNAPCPCGSGEKYKKCCMNNDLDKQTDIIDFISENKETYFKLAENTPVSSHNIYYGVKSTVLGTLDLLIKKIKMRDELDINIHQSILNHVDDLSNLAKGDDYNNDCYMEIISESLAINGWPKHQIYKYINNLKGKKLLEPLKKNEKALIISECISAKSEYMCLEEGQTIDLDALRIVFEFCYKALLDGLDNKQELSRFELTVDKNLNLKKYKIHYSDKSGASIMGQIWTTWNEEEGYDSKKVELKSRLGYLSDESINTISTLRHMISKYKESENKNINYINILRNYFNVIEEELNNCVKVRNQANSLNGKYSLDYIINIKNSENLNIIDLKEEIKDDDVFKSYMMQPFEESYDEMLKYYQMVKNNEFVTDENFKQFMNLIDGSNLLKQLSIYLQKHMSARNFLVVYMNKDFIPKNLKYIYEAVELYFIEDKYTMHRLQIEENLKILMKALDIEL